ncbi:MAG: tetratricopeptide repeat protein [Thermodesulfobacteriota bacterium]
MRFKKLLPYLVIVVLTTVAYLPAVFSGYIWDDDRYLTENPNIVDLAGLSRTWTDLTANSQYYPLVFTSFYLENKIWGLNPIGYHLVNVLLHAATACLLLLLLSRLSLTSAFIAALLFALHPICVESVAWVAERKNVLSGFFYMLSAYCLFSFFRVDRPDGPGERSWREYFPALLFFVLAILSKTVTSTLPAAMLLVLWYKRGKLTWMDVLSLLPFFLLGLGLGAITAWVEYSHVGVAGPESEIPFLFRALTAGRNLWFYPVKVFWPVGFCFNYPRWNIDPAVLSQYAWPAAAALAPALLWLFRRRLGRGPFTAFCYYAGTLFPALGFVEVYPFRFSFVADHFAYLPVIGLIVLFTETLKRKQPKMARVFFPLAAVFLFLQTLLLAGAYKDEQSLWIHTLRQNPESAFARRHLAYSLVLGGNMESALDQMNTLYSQHPEEQDDPNAEASALADFSAILMMKGQKEQALKILGRAISLAPSFSKARNNFAGALYSFGYYREALDNYQTALKEKPDYITAAWGFLTTLKTFEKAMEGPPPNDPRAVAMYEMGLSSLRSGNQVQAANLFAQALRYEPGYSNVRADLGTLNLSMGNVEEAEKDLSRVVREAPGMAKAHLNLAAVLAEKEDLAGAEAELRKAVEINPYWPKAFYNLSVVLDRGGKTHEAREAELRSRDLSEFVGGLYLMVGRALVEKGEPEKAVEMLHKGLALKENDIAGLEALGQAYWNLGRLDLAGQYMNAVRLLSRGRASEKPGAAQQQ